jgi:acyl-CoA synthetase (AMP-forming)/AMP-acid ligase II
LTATSPSTAPVTEPAFQDLPALLARHARERPQATALRQGEVAWNYAELDQRIDRVAATLQRQGLGPGDAIAVCAGTRLDYVALFLGALRAGLVVAPLAPGSTAVQLLAMAQDADARILFLDAEVAAMAVPWPAGLLQVRLDTAAFDAWLAPVGSAPQPVLIDPAWPFNIIYSSGTTGTPKGIVQPHAMRWAHIQRAGLSGYDAATVTMIATPLYSNTTLVCLIPTLAYGGCAVLMSKFDALQYLQLAEANRATHTMLVPVQYRRLMAHPDFDRFDLGSFRNKFSTSAPFHPEL